NDCGEKDLFHGTIFFLYFQRSYKNRKSLIKSQTVHTSNRAKLRSKSTRSMLSLVFLGAVLGLVTTVTTLPSAATTRVRYTTRSTTEAPDTAMKARIDNIKEEGAFISGRTVLGPNTIWFGFLVQWKK